MPPWVIAQLEVWNAIIAVTERQALAIEAELATAEPEALFRGEGELSHEFMRVS